MGVKGREVEGGGVALVKVKGACGLKAMAKGVGRLVNRHCWKRLDGGR